MLYYSQGRNEMETISLKCFCASNGVKMTNVYVKDMMLNHLGREFFYLYFLDLNQKGLSSIVFQLRCAHWFVWDMLCQGKIRGKSLPSSNRSLEAAMGTPPLWFQANDFQGQLTLGRSLRALLPSPKGTFLLLSCQIMGRRRQCRHPKDSVLPIGMGEAGYFHCHFSNPMEIRTENW